MNVEGEKGEVAKASGDSTSMSQDMAAVHSVLQSTHGLFLLTTLRLKLLLNALVHRPPALQLQNEKLAKYQEIRFVLASVREVARPLTCSFSYRWHQQVLPHVSGLGGEVRF
jgi:hypothetical protein